MARLDTDDLTAVGAPLLALDENRIDRVDDDHDSRLFSDPSTGTGFVWALTSSAGISGLLFGYDTGVISSTLVSIGSDLSGRPLTTLDKSLITSSTSLFALVASPLAGVLADKLGRKKVILVADGLFALGAAWQALTGSVGGMIFGRSAVGMAVGAASLVTPLYVSELAPSEMRGRLVTVLALFITGGQVVAYIIGWLLSTMPGGWRWMVGLGAAPAFVQLAILLFLPETPRWLVQAGQASAARRVLCKVYRVSSGSERVADRVLRAIEKEVAEEDEDESGGSKTLDSETKWYYHTFQTLSELCRVGGNRRALIIAMMLQGLQQLCGFNSLMYFSATIFQSLSFSSPTLTSLSVALTNFLFTFVAFSLIDRIGRRRILLYSIPAMVISLLICAFAFANLRLSATPSSTHQRRQGETPENSFMPVLILLSLTLYTASFASGLGNVPWQQSELFPLRVRSLGSALATATNWGSNFLVGLTFLPMMEMLSPSWTFVVYALICMAGWIGVWAIYPEMSGLGLEDVKGLLANGWGVDETTTRNHHSDQVIM
ncbi:General substrate transporter [Elaphomyces granulatus]